MENKEKIEKIEQALENAKMHIESDYRLKAHGSIDYALDLLKELKG